MPDATLMIKILIILLCLAYPVALFPQKKDDFDSKKTILVIDTVKITQYELDKYLLHKKIKDIEQLKRQNPDFFRRLINGFIDDNYFLAEALRLGFNNHDKIRQKLKSFSRFIMTQIHGPLYNVLIEQNIHIEADDILAAQKLRDKEIECSILEFPDSDRYELFMKNNTGLINSTDSFDESCISNSQNVKITNHKAAWPLLLFSKEDNEIIFQAHSNDILGPFVIDGKYYHVFLKDVSEFQDLTSDSTQKIKLDRILRMMERRKLERQHYAHIEASAQMVFFPEAINELASHLGSFSSPEQVNNKNLNDILNLPLMQYSIDSVIKYTNVDSFVEYYKFLPLKYMLKTRQDILSCLRNMVNEEYEYATAVRLGLDQAESFRLDFISYNRQLLIKGFKDSLGDSADSILVSLKNKYTMTCMIDLSEDASP